MTFSFNEALSDRFQIDGDWYELTIAGFQSNGELSDVFWTQEDASNNATLRGVVNRVPTPATLPLLGAGLLLLGLTLRRREAVDAEHS